MISEQPAINTRVEFSNRGYVIKRLDFLEVLIDECLQRLGTFLQSSLKDCEKGETNTIDGLAKALVKLFNSDKESYTGLLKAFANSPSVQKFASLPSLISFAAELGIREPVLVTPPILHVVKEDLIINREKVFTPAHQDVVSTRGSVGQVVFWIPLHKVTENNYGIEAWPGSHLLGELPNEYSEFGHTVRSDLVPQELPQYLSMSKGEVLAFSQYLVHRTFNDGNFRIAVSFRFNDAIDKDWAARKYFTPFERVQSKSTFEDKREVAPKVEKYFAGLIDPQQK